MTEKKNGSQGKRRFELTTIDGTQQYENEQRNKHKTFTPSVSIPEGFEDIEFFKYPEDTPFIKIDILPFVTKIGGVEKAVPRLSYAIHKYSVNNTFRSYICPREYDGDECPLCNIWQTYRRGMNWDDQEQRDIERKLRPQLRQLYAMRWVDGPEDQQNKIYILDAPTRTFGDLLDEKIKNRDLTDPDEAKWNQFADLLEGYNLKLTLAKATLYGNEYIKVTAIDPKPRKTQYDESWYDKVPDLTTCLHKVALAELEAAAAEMDPDERGPYASKKFQPRGDQAADESDGDATFDPNVIERNNDDENNDGTLPW